MESFGREAGVGHSNLARKISKIHKDPSHKLALERNIDQQVRDLFDNQFAKKAPRTLMKRAGHVTMYIRWCKGKNVPPFELSEQKFVAYGDDRQLEKAPSTQVESMRQALASLHLSWSWIRRQVSFLRTKSRVCALGAT